jgi:glutathione S-transferase
MKLYYAPSACSLAPHIVIREAGLDATFDKITWAPQRVTESGKDYFTINPQGAVPALETDSGEILTEAQVLMQYLASLAPAKNLLPTEGFAKWRALETLNFIATELHKGTAPLFKKPDDAQRDALHQLVANRWTLFEAKLGDKPYVLGEFSIADAYAFTVLRWAKAFKIDLSGLTKLEAYFQRVQARPAVQQALAFEGLPTS